MEAIGEWGQARKAGVIIRLPLQNFPLRKEIKPQGTPANAREGK